MSDSKTSKLLKAKFSKYDWSDCERTFTDEFSCLVVACLTELGLGNYVSVDAKSIVLGERFYLSLRKQFSQFPHGDLLKFSIKDIPEIENDVEKKSSKKKAKTATEIRFDTTKVRVESYLEDLLKKGFKRSEMNYKNGLGAKYMEFKGLTFMYCAHHMLTHAKPEPEDVYELSIGIQKFIKCMKTHKGQPGLFQGRSVLNESKNDEVSKTMLIDLMDWLEALKKKYPFDGLTILANHAKMIFFTKYDIATPSLSIAPRLNQIALIETVYANEKKGFLLNNNEVPAGGKTTVAIVALPMVLYKLNASSPKNAKKRIEIFACQQVPVKKQAAQLAYNANVKFAIASWVQKTGTVKITNHNATKDDTLILIITDPKVATELLKDNKKLGDKSKIEYWLYHDEQTADADLIGSKTFEENMELIANKPKHTILSSATMCDFEHVPSITKHHKDKYPGSYIGQLCHDTIKIGCDLMTYDGYHVRAELGCETTTELKTVIQTISDSAFLGRLYTPLVTISLWELLIANNVPVSDIKDEFKDVLNLSLEKTKQFCMKMLKVLSETDDKTVSAVCAIKKQFDDKKKVQFENFGTTDAHKYLNMNLIVHAGEDEKDENGVIMSAALVLAKKTFQPLLDKMAAAGISAKKAYNEYVEKKEALESRLKEVEKKVGKSLKKTGKDKEKNDDSNPVDKKAEIAQRKSEILDKMPTIQFPAIYQVNTPEHIKHFAPKANINTKEALIPYQLELIPYEDCSVPDWVMDLLYAGVGIYCPESKLLDDNYNTIVLEMASNNALSFVVSTRSICYGTNFPFYRIFITGEFGDDCSINLLFQLLCRAGRQGVSWKAEAYVSHKTVLRLLSFVKKTGDVVDVEAINMEARCKELLTKVV